MDSLVWTRLLLTAGVGIAVAVSSACLYLLFKPDTSESLDADSESTTAATNGQIVVRVRVPARAVGAVIGTGGQCVKRLRTDTQTVIHKESSTADETTDGDCVLAVRGLPENVVRAETAINAIIAERLASSVCKEFFVPNETVGAIIGKNGANIRSMKELSGAKITVDANNNISNGIKKRNTGLLTKVVIYGTEEKIREAKQLLDDAIANRFARQKQNSGRRAKLFR